MLAGLDEIPFPIPNILVATSFGVGVAGVVLELGGVHHGVLGGVDAVGNDNTGGEERPVRLQEGSVELLEGLNTEPRHDDGFRGYRGRKVRFDGLGRRQRVL
jgi:hypothetical protein